MTKKTKKLVSRPKSGNLRIASTAPWMEAKTDTPTQEKQPSAANLKQSVDDFRWEKHLENKNKTDEQRQKEYTEKQTQAADNTRTWRSDVADVLHGLGEAAFASNPYTAVAYFGAKALDGAFKNGITPETVVNAGYAAMPWMHVLAPMIQSGVQKGAQFMTSNITGKWTPFFGREYRLNPNIVGVNGGGIQSRPIGSTYNNVEDLINQNTVLRPDGTRAVGQATAARVLNSDLDQVVNGIRTDAPIMFGRNTEGLRDIGVMWEERPGAFQEAAQQQSRRLANKGLIPKTQSGDAQGYPIQDTDALLHRNGPLRNYAEQAFRRTLQENEGVVSMEEVRNLLKERLGRDLTEEDLMELSGYIDSGQHIFNRAGDKTASILSNQEFDYYRNGINRILNNSTLEPYITTRNLKTGDVPYKLEELVENGRLRPKTALEEIHSGSRGEENFFDRGDEGLTRASKYFKTKYGGIDRSSLGNVSEDNPMDRSGVIVTTSGGQYSIDSFNHALKYLFRSLRKGRNFYPLQTRTIHTEANDLGQLNRYEDLTSPELQEILKQNKGVLPKDINVHKLDSGTLLFSRVRNGMREGLGKLRVRDPEDIIKAPNEQITKINELFGLNIPLAEVNPSGKIMWPNIYGILYNKGGKINGNKEN